MKVEEGFGGGAWNEEEKAMLDAVLSSRAFDYLISHSVSCDSLLMAAEIDDNLQNKHPDLVDRPKHIQLFSGKLRSRNPAVVPNISKMDEASLLGDAVAYTNKVRSHGSREGREIRQHLESYFTSLQQEI